MGWATSASSCLNGTLLMTSFHTSSPEDVKQRIGRKHHVMWSVVSKALLFLATGCSSSSGHCIAQPSHFIRETTLTGVGPSRGDWCADFQRHIHKAFTLS